VFHYTWNATHTVGVVFRVPLPVERDALRWDTTDLAGCVWVREEELEKYLVRDDYNFHAALAGFEQLLRLNDRN
jgi:hypothetical protein